MDHTATRIAVITGGGSGIGRAVAQALITRGGWQIHVFDVKDTDEGQESNTRFHLVDTTDYKGLATAFKSAFIEGGRRLDFVFANAGVLERANWYAASADSDEPPPEPDWTALDINLKGCMNTVRIARHYIAQSPEKGSIAVTSSSAAIWASQCTPIYSASKRQLALDLKLAMTDQRTDGIVGFIRSIADWYYKSDGIRVNTLCPSVVRTNIIPERGLQGFSSASITPMEVISDTVLKFIDGDRIIDARGEPAGTNFGITVVTGGDRIYFNEMPDYCNADHKAMVEGGHMENQIGLLD